MSNQSFKFKRFEVWHDLCAMKVGTDGVLLGAWAHGGQRVLDVGTGSGLIALFMAQRFPDAEITALDIDRDACLQAERNVAGSEFSGRIKVVETSFQNFNDGKFDAIVCNPPFFANALKNPDKKRAVARHADTLPFNDLFTTAASLLDDDGEFSVVIPASCRSDFDMEAAFAGLFPLRVCAIRTVAHKPVSRYLLSYGKHHTANVEETSACINNDDMSRSEWYSELTKDFYL